MKNRTFKDKVVVVTGAGSGIGAAVSRRFGEAGARLGMLDMDTAAVKAQAESLRGQGVEALALRCDVAGEDQSTAAIRQILDHYGGIDVLVNNAGITQRSAFADTRMHVYRKVMDVNFFGALHCTAAAMPSLLQRRGVVIVIESLAGVAPLLGRTGYCASKHALHGFFTSLRAEIRKTGVHIMLVCPGFVATNLQRRALGGDGQVTDHPQSMVGKPTTAGQVADAIYRGALKRKPMLVLTPVGKLSYWINRFAPLLYERIMARQLSHELRR